MSDVPGPLPWDERHGDDLSAADAQMTGWQAQMHTSMPGVIVSYDAATMTAVVQPALQAFHRKVDGKIVPTTLTTVSHVPVLFPGGGGHILTFPVAAGDECWLVFSERSIDNWFAMGGVQQPSDRRMHDLNDPVCYVGVRSQPKVPGGVSSTTVQLRSDDERLLVELDPGGGTVRLVSPLKVRMETPRLEVTGDIIDHCDSQAHTNADMRSIYNSHTHGGIQSGSGHTAVPDELQRE